MCTCDTLSTDIYWCISAVVFTPMHDASHGSIATVGSGHRYINDAVGVIAGVCFPLPYYAFKCLHLLHHKYTNDPVNDPDTFAGAGPWYFLPFRWMLIEVKQYHNYLPKVFALQRPLFESVASLTLMGGYVTAAVVATKRGYGTEVLYGWIFPGRIALALLAFAFDYLPHRPHDVTRAESDYKATCVISVVGEWTSPLTYPLLYQNYHNIHHLAPYIPFYYYATIWHAAKTELLARGTVVKPLFGAGNDSSSMKTPQAVHATPPVNRKNKAKKIN
jgi:beta-carotene hydroxylase